MVGTEYREAQTRDNQFGNTAGMVFSRSQLSAKIAVNMAVSTKSNPLVVVCLVYVWFILLVSVVNLLQKCCKFEFFY